MYYNLLFEVLEAFQSPLANTRRNYHLNTALLMFLSKKLTIVILDSYRNTKMKNSLNSKKLFERAFSNKLLDVKSSISRTGIAPKPLGKVDILLKLGVFFLFNCIRLLLKSIKNALLP
jgi:hypothetical protein